MFETHVRAEYVHNLRDDVGPKKILFSIKFSGPREHSTFTVYFVLNIRGIVLKMKRALIGGWAVGEIKRRKNI